MENKELTTGDPVEWPKIDINHRTPLGFGDREGGKACFGMLYNSCRVYIPHSFIPDLETAREVFRQILPVLDKMWPNCGDRETEVIIPGEKRKKKIFLKFAFSHILIRLHRW